MKLTKKQKDRIFIIAMLAVPTIHFIVFWVIVNFGSFRLAFIDQYTEEFSLENFAPEAYRRSVLPGSSIRPV